MVDVFDDTFQALDTYLKTALAPADVIMAFGDERRDRVRSYPAVTHMLYDIHQDPPNRYSGIREWQETHPTDPDFLINTVALPIPIQLHVQLDTYCETRRQEWSLTQKVIQLLEARYTKIVTAAGAILHLVPVSHSGLDQLDDGVLWRKSFRCFIRRWFEHPQAAQEAYMVLSRHLDMNGSKVELVPAQG